MILKTFFHQCILVIQHFVKSGLTDIPTTWLHPVDFVRSHGPGAELLHHPVHLLLVDVADGEASPLFGQVLAEEVADVAAALNGDVLPFQGIAAVDFLKLRASCGQLGNQNIGNFAFAIAALLGGRLDSTWARWSRARRH